jgi:hypothetical protein
MKSTSVRGTPFTKIGPSGNSGFRQGGGNADNTVGTQYRGSGINTAPNERGTPAQYAHGNPGDAMRVVSRDRYGKVIDDAAGDQANPAANGTGVILNGDPPRDMLDSPVPMKAPMFDEGFIAKEDRAHLGGGNEEGMRSLIEGGGVMSRGMVGTSKPSGAEDELTTDDTLPSVAPAGKP